MGNTGLPDHLERFRTKNKERQRSASSTGGGKIPVQVKQGQNSQKPVKKSQDSEPEKKKQDPNAPLYSSVSIIGAPGSPIPPATKSKSESETAVFNALFSPSGNSDTPTAETATKEQKESPEKTTKAGELLRPVLRKPKAKWKVINDEEGSDKEKVVSFLNDDYDEKAYAQLSIKERKASKPSSTEDIESADNNDFFVLLNSFYNSDVTSVEEGSDRFKETNYHHTAHVKYAKVIDIISGEDPKLVTELENAVKDDILDYLQAGKDLKEAERQEKLWEKESKNEHEDVSTAKEQALAWGKEKEQKSKEIKEKYQTINEGMNQTLIKKIIDLNSKDKLTDEQKKALVEFTDEAISNSYIDQEDCNAVKLLMLGVKRPDVRENAIKELKLALQRPGLSKKEKEEINKEIEDEINGISRERLYKYRKSMKSNSGDNHQDAPTSQFGDKPLFEGFVEKFGREKKESFFNRVFWKRRPQKPAVDSAD